VRSALFVEVGLVFLSLAFILSSIGPLVLDPSWRLVVLLEANPQRYLEYVSNAFFYLVLPSVIGISLIIVGYTRDNKNLAELTPQWALVVIAGIFLAWGSLYLFFNYRAYQNAITYTDYNRIQGLDNLILTIYGARLLAGELFVLAGLLLLYPPFKTLHGRLRDRAENPRSTKNV